MYVSLQEFYIIEFHQILPIYSTMYNKHKAYNRNVGYHINLGNFKRGVFNNVYSIKTKRFIVYIISNSMLGILSIMTTIYDNFFENNR